MLKRQITHCKIQHQINTYKKNLESTAQISGDGRRGNEISILSFEAVNSKTALKSNWGLFNSNRSAKAKMWLMTREVFDFHFSC